MLRACVLLSIVSLANSQCTTTGAPAAAAPTTASPAATTPLAATPASPSSSSQCPGGIPAAEVKGFLDIHNKMRQSISAGTYVAKGKKMPAAKTPIPNLVWDCDLERSAQKVASTCVFAHSTNRNNTGENLYYYMSSANVPLTGKGKEASDDWESEFQKYGWSDIKFTNAVFSSGVAHATQMAWAKTTKMGCGMTPCQGGKQVIVACQYRVAGNMLGENVYEPK